MSNQKPIAYIQRNVWQSLSSSLIEMMFQAFGHVQCLIASGLHRVSGLTNGFADAVAPAPHEAVQVDEMIAHSWQAQRVFETWNDQQIAQLIEGIAVAIATGAEELAAVTVAETGMGNVPDKTQKILGASVGLLPTLGLDKSDFDSLAPPHDVIELKTPVGVIFGLVPITNPVPTAIFKVISALKGRNAIILSFHRSCLGIGDQVGQLIQDVLVEHNAPLHLVQWIKKRTDRTTTARFMQHPDVSMVLATGGQGLVRAAYSSGTPTIGVGPGNAPCWIASDASIDDAAQAVVTSKSFDHGIICGSEHNLVVDRAVRSRFVAALEAHGAAVLSGAELPRFLQAVVNTEMNHLRPDAIGQSAASLAARAFVQRPYPIRLVVVPCEWEGSSCAMAREKMAPVLSMFTVEGDQQAKELCSAILAGCGQGHTAVVHTKCKARAIDFGKRMRASRVLVNTPATHGVIGLTTGLAPSLVLGCGSEGGNSTSDNVTWKHLVNTRRIAWGRPASVAAAA